MENQNFNIEKTPRDIIILHNCTTNNNHMMYDFWDMECDDIFFCHSGPLFALLPPWTQKIKILKKWKKTPEDIIILQMCTINDSHMMNGSWDMQYNRQNFFGILDHFLSFYPLWTQKIKVLKKWKTLEILPFYTWVP